jgi:hypothetical protein
MKVDRLDALVVELWMNARVRLKPDPLDGAQRSSSAEALVQAPAALLG